MSDGNTHQNSPTSACRRRQIQDGSSTKNLVQHLTEKQLRNFVSQRLEPAELLAVSDHLDDCKTCRQQTQTSMNLEGAFLATWSDVFDQVEQSPAHLTAEEIEQFVDNSLAGERQQVVADHLSSCDRCALAVADVREFRNELVSDREYRPQSEGRVRPGWWRRTFGSLPSLFRVSPVPAFGGAALAVLLFALIGWLMLRKQSEQRPTQEIATGPTPAVQPSPIASPVESPAQTAVVAQLNDGNRVLTLDADGDLSGADDLPVGYQNLLKAALTNQRIARSPLLNGLSRPSSALMGSKGSKETFSVKSPVGTVLLTDRPTFRWSPMTGVSSYVVEVYDSKFNLITRSLQLATDSWTVPQPLPRGEVYAWQVKANRDGEEVTSPKPPAPQAKFRILDQAKADELAKASRAYSSSHLVRALLYADAGLIDESEEQLRLLLKANPNSEVARKLLRQIQAQRR